MYMPLLTLNGEEYPGCARHGAQHHDPMHEGSCVGNRGAKANREVTWGCKSPADLGDRNRELIGNCVVARRRGKEAVGEALARGTRTA